MKKFLGMCMGLLMMSTVVNAANFEDTEGKNCEFAVDRIAYMGIVNGTGGNKFEPEKAVTRAELSKMVTGIVAKENGNADKAFSDVEGHWGKAYISKAASLGILNGYSDGTFKPDNSVSYAEAIAIIMRCMGYTDLEQNVSGAWYENYISKMKEIGLNSELEEFEATAPANRGDIAIILWNMLSSESRADETKTMLEEYFPDFYLWEDVKITDIAVYNGKIVYVTSEGNFYVEDRIDFSDLGGAVSGLYDSSNHVVIGMMIDEGKNYKKISGSLKSITEAGYESFKCANVMGYGDKEHAEYVEIFVDEETDEVKRTVFYDTRKSHFAEKIKVGDTRITIESRDVYDQSVVYLKDGSKITYNILRNENVMDIDVNSVLVHDGKIVDWTMVPNDSVVREIVKDRIYTYTHKFVDGKIESGKIDFRTLKMNGIEYDVAENCICQNIETKQTMRLVEGLTRKDIIKLGEVDENVRVYLNEFDEIVKLEFSYGIWEIQAEEERQEEYEDFKVYLDMLGFVTSVSDRYNVSNDENEKQIRFLSLPNGKSNTYKAEETDLKIGDFVYLPSGEDKAKKITGKIEIEDKLEVIYNYLYPITEDKINDYTITSDTEIIEIELMKDESDDKIYSKCTMKEKELDELYDYTKYKNIHVIVDDDDNVIRLYAIREVGLFVNVGIVGDIQNTISGDVLLETKLFLINENKKTERYLVSPVMGYGKGDLITFEIVVKKNDEKYDKLVVEEIYRHENIGSKYDLIVKRNNNGVITFRNSDLIIDKSEEYFEYNGKTYYFDDYIFINARVKLDKETSKWNFTSFEINNNKNKFDLKSYSRIAIDEITGTIIAYDGYEE